MPPTTQLDLFAPPPEDDALKLVAFDLETTGLNPAKADIIEVAGVRFTLPGEKVETFQELANPGYALSDEITRIDRITTQMVAGARTPIEIVAAFMAWAGDDALLLAHNAPFDARFLAACYRKNRIPLPEREVIDTLPWARASFPKLANHKLGTLLRHIGACDDGLHRGLADSFGVVALARRLAEGRKDPEKELMKRAASIEQLARVKRRRGRK